MPYYDIDLTLDSFMIPAITETFPFGTKVIPTAENKGGLSTFDVNSNVMLPFTRMRPRVCSADSVTSRVEYDAKIVFSAPQGTTPASGYTLTLGTGDYVGCTVTFTNLLAHACTVRQSDGTTTLFSVPAGKTMSAMWNGTAWLWTTAGSVTAGDPTPVSSAAVQAAVGALKEKIVEVYKTDEMTVTRDTPWRIEGSKPGYYPVSVDYMQGWAGSVLSSPENIGRTTGAFSIYGFASAVFDVSASFIALVSVVWVPA